MTAAIVDTGPLVAFFDRAEWRHHWVAQRIEERDARLLVCEPVLAEWDTPMSLADACIVRMSEI